MPVVPLLSLKSSISKAEPDPHRTQQHPAKLIYSEQDTSPGHNWLKAAHRCLTKPYRPQQYRVSERVHSEKRDMKK